MEAKDLQEDNKNNVAFIAVDNNGNAKKVKGSDLALSTSGDIVVLFDSGKLVCNAQLNLSKPLTDFRIVAVYYGRFSHCMMFTVEEVIKKQSYCGKVIGDTPRLNLSTDANQFMLDGYSSYHDYINFTAINSVYVRSGKNHGIWKIVGIK